MLPTFTEAAPNTTPLIINNDSQERERRAEATAVKGEYPKDHKPHAVLRARETTKEKHKSGKIDLEASPLESQELRKQAGPPQGLSVTEETLGVKAANTEPALVIRLPGAAEAGSGSPTRPSFWCPRR